MTSILTPYGEIRLSAAKTEEGKLRIYADHFPREIDGPLLSWFGGKWNKVGLWELDRGCVAEIPRPTEEDYNGQNSTS